MLTADRLIDAPTARHEDSLMPRWAADVARWTAFLQATGMSPVTVRTYRRSLITFIADSLIEPNDATEDDLVDYLHDLAAKGHVRAMTVRTFRSYYAWARRRGVIRTNPAEAFKAKVPKYGPADALTEEEVTRVIVAAAWREPRRAWAILLMYATGIRLGSAVAILPEDVRGDILYLRVAKGDRPYAVQLGPIGQAAVRGLMETANHRLIGPAEGAVWSWVHQASVDSGVRVHPHLLRHTWATVQSRKGTPTRVIQEMGNWADLSQLSRYAHVNDHEKRTAAL